MKITITIDIDPIASGYADEDDLKDNITDFARDLIINGAENEEVELTLLSVEYPCEVYLTDEMPSQPQKPRNYKMW